MFVSVMTNNCSLEHWRNNSRVDHVISDQGPGGGRVELSTILREDLQCMILIKLTNIKLMLHYTYNQVSVICVIYNI